MPLNNTNISFGSESRPRFAQGVVLPLLPPFAAVSAIYVERPYQGPIVKRSDAIIIEHWKLLLA